MVDSTSFLYKIKHIEKMGRSIFSLVEEVPCFSVIILLKLYLCVMYYMYSFVCMCVS